MIAGSEPNTFLKLACTCSVTGEKFAPPPAPPRNRMPAPPLSWGERSGERVRGEAEVEIIRARRASVPMPPLQVSIMKIEEIMAMLCAAREGEQGGRAGRTSLLC